MSTQATALGGIAWTGTSERMKARYGGLLLQVTYGESIEEWQWSVSFGVDANLFSLDGFATTADMAKRRAVAVAVRYHYEGFPCPFEYAQARGWVTEDGEPTALIRPLRERAEALAQELLRCSFADLLERNATDAHPVLVAPAAGYDANDLGCKFAALADLYDRAQAARGDARRAVRT